MSKNTDKISKALKSKGYEVTCIEWTPIGGSPIMCGPEGGWYIDFEPAEGMTPPYGLRSYNIMAYNIGEALGEIEELPDCIVKNAV